MTTQWHIINTRPLTRASLLNQVLRSHGFDVIALPLLELIAETLTPELNWQLQQMSTMHMVIVVSPTAAELGLIQLQLLDICPQQLNCQWIAVGTGTATVLQQAGLQPLIPQLETSEGILSLPALHQLASQSQIMFWRGHGGRQLMLQALQQANHQVMSVDLYRRRLPLESMQQYQYLVGLPALILLITSGVSWQHWLQLAEQSGQLIYPAYVLVLGERIYQLIQHWFKQHHQPQQQTTVILIDNLQPETILTMLEKLPKCQQT